MSNDGLGVHSFGQLTRVVAGTDRAGHRRMDSQLKYQGNTGNLLQHWVLCELIQGCNKHWASLHFVDAYAMAPLATNQVKPSPSLFTHAQVRETPNSAYEEAWRRLVEGRIGYPNSAAFVADLWKGCCSMSLCDNDGPTALALKSWAVTQAEKPAGARAEVWPEDWRVGFSRRAANSKDLTVLSFDPDLFTLHTSTSGREMTLSDIKTIAAAVDPINRECVIQLSTYNSARGLNRQTDVERTIAEGFRPSGLELLAVIRANKEMMSIVIGRGSSSVASELAGLSERFDLWFENLNYSWQLEQFRQRSDNARKLPPLPRPRRSP